MKSKKIDEAAKNEKRGKVKDTKIYSKRWESEGIRGLIGIHTGRQIGLKVIIPRKQCKIKTMLQQETNSKWYVARELHQYCKPF